MVHLALITTQVIFGASTIVGKLGMPSVNPITFALIREAFASVLLLIVARYKEGAVLQRAHLGTVLLAGVFLFANQLFFIMGVKLSNPVIGSAWQPSQPIWGTAIAIMIGRERATFPKVAGILFAFGGAAFLVVFGEDIKGGSNEVMGNILFFLNCTGTALYVITCKPLLQSYPPISVTAWCYCTGSVGVFLTAMLVNNIPACLAFVCHDCNGNAWDVPMITWISLLWWVLMPSCVAYMLLSWGNKYANASSVLIYTALQPLTSGVIAAIMIATGAASYFPKAELAMPGLNSLGAIGILLGLVTLCYEKQINAFLCGPPADANPKVEPLLSSEDVS